MKEGYFEKMQKYAEKVSAETGFNVEVRREWDSVLIYVDGEYCQGWSPSGLTIKSVKESIDWAIERKKRLAKHERDKV